MNVTHIRTRFAPSPTGYLHIGSLRTALYAYALAKHSGGDFILRIEDTDQKREVVGTTEKIYESLKLFNLNWDEGPLVGGPYTPYIQSERVKTGIYQKAVDQLLSTDHAFYCFCKAKSKEEIFEDRSFKMELRDPCRSLTKEQIEEKIANGEKPAVRLKVPENEKISYIDFVTQKEVTWMTNIVDDAMLLKSDGFPTYHLAVVVDDTDMKITHVLRGHDWQPSTPIHLLVYKFLKFQTPQIGHLTDILNADGHGKLSKRKGNVSCEQFLSEGYLPEALLNFILLLGWAPKDNQELFTLEQFVEKFDPNGFQKANPRFDPTKLNWLNGYYLRLKSDEQLFSLIRPLFDSSIADEKIKNVIPLAKERITKINDIVSLTSFIFKRPNYENGLEINNQFVADALAAIEVSDWTKESIESNLLDVTAKNNYNRGDFFMNLRIAISGQKVTPPLTESMLIIGKEEVVNRLKSLL